MKPFFSLLIFGMLPIGLFAQKQMGIKLLPGVTLTNLRQEDNLYSNDIQNINWGNKGSAGFGCGWVLDLPFENNRLALSTGLWYSLKNFQMDIETPIGVDIYNPETQTTTRFDILKDPQYLLHYLQLPVTVKVFANPTTKGFRFYFQVGTTIELKLAEQALDKGDNYLYQLSQIGNDGKAVFKSVDIGIYGAIGSEWKLKSGHGVFGAISVNKGLLKQMNSLKWLPGSADLDYFMNVKISQISIEFGYMF